MQLDVISWKKKEFCSFFCLSALLFITLFAFRYPVLFGDSKRYLTAALSYTTNPYALTVTSMLLRPGVLLIGPWAFPFVQILSLAYVMTCVLRDNQRSVFTGLIAVVLSAAFYIASAVMMESYTFIGLLALFLLLNGNRDPILAGILGVCFVAHYENVFLFSVTAIFYTLVFTQKFSRLGALLAFFAALICGVVFSNYILEGKPRFFHVQKYHFPTRQILHQSPELIKAYTTEYPEAGLSKLANEKKYSFSQKFKIGFNRLGDLETIQEEQKQFLHYVITNHPLQLVELFIKNTTEFLLTPKLKKTINPNTKEVHRERMGLFIEKEFPKQIKQANESFLRLGQWDMEKISLFYFVSYYISFGSCLIFLGVSIVLKRLRERKIYPFIVYAVTAAVINAMIMSNLSGNVGRFHLRTLLLVCLGLCLLIAEWRDQRRAIRTKK